MTDIILSTQNGEPVASSREIAKRFGKEHKNVMQGIANLVAENSAAKSMFHPSTFENRGRQYPMYLMNRDGFSLLAMGFTGKEATAWKLKYIEAFNAMEKELTDQRRKQAEVSNRQLNDAIAAVNDAKRNLAIARRNHDYFVDMRNKSKALLSDVRSTHAKNCDLERKYAQIERDWQNCLDSQISRLALVSGGLPGFEEVMETAIAIALPEATERK